MQTMEASWKSLTNKGGWDEMILQKTPLNLEEDECIS